MRNAKVLRGIPKPNSDAELEILSEWYFGMPVHLRTLQAYRTGGRYEVREGFDSYDPFGRDYDRHRWFWDYVCGPLTCGGTARASYGQFEIRDYRHYKRLKTWVSSRRKEDSSSVRQPFVRLAGRITGSGRTSRNADRDVLIGGREDGAPAASFSGRGTA